MINMSREKGKQHGVVKYKPKSFSIDIETIYRMDQYAWVSFSPIVNKLLIGFLDRLDQQDLTNPTEIVDRLMGEKEETT